MNEYGEEITYHMSGSINLNGYPSVSMQNMFTPADGGQPAAMLAAISMGDRFGRIYDNPYNVPDIRTFSSISSWFASDAGHVWKARAPMAPKPVRVKTINIEAMLRPYRGEGIVQHIPVDIPASQP